MVGGGLVGGMVSVLAELACEAWWEWNRQWNAAYDELLNIYPCFSYKCASLVYLMEGSMLAVI
jgi:hypothetical protein